MTVKHKMMAVSTSVIFQLLKTCRIRIKSLILCGNQNKKTMRTICTILCLLCLTILPVQIEAASIVSKNIVVKKIPRKPTNSKEGIRVPTRITCNFSIEDGIQPIDTSDIYLYEIWNSKETILTASFGDETQFVRYILECTSDCSIKMYSDDYLYTGNTSIIP